MPLLQYGCLGYQAINPCKLYKAYKPCQTTRTLSPYSLPGTCRIPHRGLQQSGQNGGDGNRILGSLREMSVAAAEPGSSWRGPSEEPPAGFRLPKEPKKKKKKKKKGCNRGQSWLRRETGRWEDDREKGKQLQRQVDALQRELAALKASQWGLELENQAAAKAFEEDCVAKLMLAYVDVNKRADELVHKVPVRGMEGYLRHRKPGFLLGRGLSGTEFPHFRDTKSQ